MVLGTLVSHSVADHRAEEAWINASCSAWIVVAEVWPLSARPYGIALGASSNWMNNFIVGQVTPDMITGMKYGTFILFGLLITLGAGFVWFFGNFHLFAFDQH